jgi:hypothetical protein
LHYIFYICSLKSKANDSSLFTVPTPGNPCSMGFFACDAGSRCLPLAVMCDGELDCFDGQDEASCTHNNSRVYQVQQVGVDERNSNSTALRLYWWIPIPTGIKFQYLPSYAEVSSQHPQHWHNHTEWVDTIQTQIDGLRPYTSYNLTVYVKLKNHPRVFPPAQYITATTAEGGIMCHIFYICSFCLTCNLVFSTQCAPQCDCGTKECRVGSYTLGSSNQSQRCAHQLHRFHDASNSNPGDHCACRAN